MFAEFLYSLRRFVGGLLVGLAFLATTLAVIVFCLMAWLILHEPGAVETNEWQTLRWCVGIAAVGGLLMWLGSRMYRKKLKPGEARPPSFRLVESPSGRSERWIDRYSWLFWPFAVVLWIWEAVPADPGGRVALILVGVPVALLLLQGYILLHELGHCAAGTLLGLEPARLRVGGGRLWASWQTRNGFRWEWGRRPAGGFMEMLHRDERGFRWRQFGFVAGGPLMDAALFATLQLVILPLCRGFLLPPALGALDAGVICRGLLFVQGAFLFGNLMPQIFFFDGRWLHTDGWWLFRVLFFPTEKVREAVLAHLCAHLDLLWRSGRRAQAFEEIAATALRYPEHAAALLVSEALWHQETKDPDAQARCVEHALVESRASPADKAGQVWSSYAAALAARDDLDGARSACAAVLAQRADDPPGERATLLDAFACLPLLHTGTRALLPDAAAWGQEALALAPDTITVRGTWGALLVELGREAEGAEILRDVLARTESDLDRGIAAFYLALVAHRQGDRREMRKQRETARRLCRQPVLMARFQTDLSTTG